MPAIKNRNWLPSLFNDFFGDEWLALSQYKRMSTPAVNVIENEHDYTVEVAAPGMTKDDFHIDVNADNELVINLEKRSETMQPEAGNTYDKRAPHDAGAAETGEYGHRHAENREASRNNGTTSEAKPAKKGHYLRREFFYSSFRQSFTLPESIERDKISAKMENGVLKIEIPKKTTAAATPTTRCIEIE